MKRIIRLFSKVGKCVAIAAIFLTSINHASAYTKAETKALLDSVAARLAVAQTAADSIPLMIDQFDLSPTENTLMHIRRIYFTAMRAGGHDDIALDMLRQWANLGMKWHDDEIINEALGYINAMPESEDKRQTMIFVNSGIAEAHQYKSEAERMNYLRQILRECADMPDDVDPYESVTKHFILVDLLSKETNGELLSKYLGRLDAALSALPGLPHSYLRSKFNSRAVHSYWNNDEFLKSVNIDRNQVVLTRRLEKLFHKRNRYFKNYNMQNYHALRRILRNYDILSEKEIRDYFSQIEELARVDPEVAECLASDPTARIGIWAIEGKYKENLPMIKYLAYNAKNIYDQRMFMRRLIEFAEKAGDTELKQEAETKNAELLEKFVNHFKADERVRELQILYEVNELRRIAAADQLKVQKAKTALLYLMAIIILVLLVIFVVLYLHARKRRLAYKSETSRLNAELAAAGNCHEELATLRATMRRNESEKNQMMSFLSHELTTPLNAIINYSRLIVENANDDTRDYMRHFASIVEVNADILQEVAIDFSEFQIAEGRKMPLHCIPVDAGALAEVIVESVKPQLKEGVDVELIPFAGTDPMITTDPRRVQIVLLSCISNLALLTERGKITLEISIDREASTCTFVMTASGRKVSEEEAGKILATWACFDDDAKIQGLGLPNCQVIVNALKGSLTLDGVATNEGARLLFTIPA